MKSADYIRMAEDVYGKAVNDARQVAEEALARYRLPGSTRLDRLAFDEAADHYQLVALRADKARRAAKRFAKRTPQE
jgi:hypothetical protein